MSNADLKSLPSIIPELNVAVAAAIGRPRTVLDVQCGRGLHGADAKQAGAQVVAIEGRPDEAATARRLIDEVIALDPRDFAQLRPALGDRKFDVVLLSDVLYHADDPLGVLQFYRAYLEDGGRI